jgi:hypothetical protein
VAASRTASRTHPLNTQPLNAEPLNTDCTIFSLPDLLAGNPAGRVGYKPDLTVVAEMLETPDVVGHVCTQ